MQTMFMMTLVLKYWNISDTSVHTQSAPYRHANVHAYMSTHTHTHTHTHPHTHTYVLSVGQSYLDPPIAWKKCSLGTP